MLYWRQISDLESNINNYLEKSEKEIIRIEVKECWWWWIWIVHEGEYVKPQQAPILESNQEQNGNNNGEYDMQNE